MPRTIKCVPEAQRRVIIERLGRGESVRSIAKYLKIDHRKVSTVKAWAIEQAQAQEEAQAPALPVKIPEAKPVLGLLPGLEEEIDAILEGRDPVPVPRLPPSSPPATAALVPRPNPFKEGEKKANETAPEKERVEKASSLRKYRRALRKLVPVEQRAAVLAEVLSNTKNPFVAIRALEKIDSIDGLEAAAKEVTPEKPVPLFIFPHGTAMSFSPVAKGGILDAETQTILKEDE